MSGNGTRPTAGETLPNRARLALRRAQRAERKMAEATADLELAQGDLAALMEETAARIGRPVPANALLLDVLSLVEVLDRNIWRWRGIRNNKNLPTLRVDMGEKSVVRFLAIEFGVITEEDFGMLYPVDGDTDDVNPWHRVLRPSTRPIGNTWAFRLPETSP